MINLDQFEIFTPHQQPNQLDLHKNQSSFETEPVNCPSAVTIEDIEIEQINDLCSSMQYSQNLLDRMDECLNGKLAETREIIGSESIEGEGGKVKNETKNIPKNFGKGIITFMERHQSKIRRLVEKQGIVFREFMNRMHQQKRRINTIADLRRLWTSESWGRCLRIVSNLFFRKYAIGYIFNSRISNYSSHIKYRQSLWRALREPEKFNHIKEY